MIPIVGEDVEKQTLSYIDSGIVNWYSIQKSIWKDLARNLRLFISFAPIITYSKNYFKDLILNRTCLGAKIFVMV